MKYLVSSGQLMPGEEMPPIRALAEQLVINPNTVARAYRELEIAGVVEKRRTTGTFVSGGASPLSREERIKILTQRVDALVAEARQLAVPIGVVQMLIVERNGLLPNVAESEPE